MGYRYFLRTVCDVKIKIMLKLAMAIFLTYMAILIFLNFPTLIKKYISSGGQDMALNDVSSFLTKKGIIKKYKSKELLFIERYPRNRFDIAIKYVGISEFDTNTIYKLDDNTKNILLQSFWDGNKHLFNIDINTCIDVDKAQFYRFKKSITATFPVIIFYKNEAIFLAMAWQVTLTNNK